MTISNIQVQATEGGNVPAAGTILRTSANPGTAIIAGITPDATSFGALSQTVGALRLYTVLPGQTFTDTNTVVGSGITGIAADQTAGSSFTIPALVAADREFNVASTYAGAKTISYSGPGGVPSYTTAVGFNAGLLTNTLTTTLTKVETTTIAATDGTVAGVASSGLKVIAGLFAKLQLLVPGEAAAPGSASGKTGTPNAQTATSAFSVIVKAVDANWNLTTNVTDTVSFSSSDAAATLPAPAALAGGTQTVIVTLNTPGSQTLTATDSDNGAIAANTSPPITVNSATTTTMLSSAVNPSVFGQSVTFTATVTATVGTPTGTVTFKDGAITLGTASLSGGQATFSTGSLSVAAHSMTAVYGGDSTYNVSTSVIFTQTVNKAGTTTGLSSSPNPTVFGQSVTFTATVNAATPGAGTPTGTVTFKDGATTLGTAALSGGQATFSTSSLSVGSHATITVAYGGDGNFNTSTSTNYTQTVNKSDTTTTLSPSPSPSVAGQPVGFTATVSAVAPGAGTRTGTVTFTIDGGSPTNVTVNASGQATLTNALATAGSHTISAAYNGDASFNGSAASDLTQTVNTANSATTVSSSFNPSVFGQSVTFTARVVAVSPGAGTPTGTVTFSIDGSP